MDKKDIIELIKNGTGIDKIPAGDFVKSSSVIMEKDSILPVAYW